LSLSNIVAITARDNRSLAIAAELKILSLAQSGSNDVLHFWSFAGRNYSLQFAPDLTSGNWQPTDITGLAGTGQEIIVTETNAIANAPQGFYRIMEVSQ
jgi:hypothetical protein